MVARPGQVHPLVPGVVCPPGVVVSVIVQAHSSVVASQLSLWCSVRLNTGLRRSTVLQIDDWVSVSMLILAKGVLAIDHSKSYLSHLKAFKKLIPHVYKYYNQL